MVPARVRRPARPPGSACARRPRPASSGASTPSSSTPPSAASSSCCGRRARTWPWHLARSTHAASCRRRRQPTCARHGSTGCSASTLPTVTSSGCSTRSASPSAPRPAPGVQEVAIPSWRPDCAEEIDVIEEIARHYGYERIGRAVPASAHPGALTPRQQDRRADPPGHGGPRPVRGHADAAARPRRPRAGRAGRGRHRAGQPAWSPRRACCARRCGPGLLQRARLQRVAPQPRRGAVRARPRVPAARGAAARCPTSARCSPPCRPAPTRSRPPAGGASWRWPWPSKASRWPPPSARAAPDPQRRAAGGRMAPSSALVGEIDPAVLEAHGISERVARARGRPAAPAGAARTATRSTAGSAATRPATSTWPSPCRTACPRPR